VHGSDIDIRVDVELTVKHNESMSEFKHAYSLWSVAFFDILNFSTCLYHISLRDDTTETLQDPTPHSTHVHRAQWAIQQQFFNTGTSLFSKNTEGLPGARYVSLRVFADDDFSGAPWIVTSAATPEAVRRFGAELRECYDELESAQDLFNSWLYPDDPAAR
jgi:hypothetical protein